jgi:hypothetical protein
MTTDHREMMYQVEEERDKIADLKHKHCARCFGPCVYLCRILEEIAIHKDNIYSLTEYDD